MNLILHISKKGGGLQFGGKSNHSKVRECQTGSNFSCLFSHPVLLMEKIAASTADSRVYRILVTKGYKKVGTKLFI